MVENAIANKATVHKTAHTIAPGSAASACFERLTLGISEFLAEIRLFLQRHGF